MRFNTLHLLVSFFLFFTTFSIYLQNLSPSVYGGDSGDFLTAIVTKGITHPSGYPLFTLLGILFNNLPLSSSPAWKIGLLCALSSSLSVVLLYLIVFEFTKRRLIAIITAFSLSFTYPFWLYAEVVEVFSFSFFIVLFLFYVLLLYSIYKSRKLFYLLSFLLGISLANHLLVIVLFPTVLLFVLKAGIRRILNLRTLFISFVLLLLGLLPYLYIPIASFTNPPIAWSVPTTVEGFTRYVTRQDYGWLPGETLNLWIRIISLRAYILYWLTQIPPIVIVVSFLGMFFLLWKRSFTNFFAVLIPFVLSGPFYVLYGAITISNPYLYGVYERFYGFSLLFFLIFFGFGINALVVIFEFLFRKKKKMLVQTGTFAIQCLFFMIPVFLFLLNYQRTDFSSLWLGDNLGRDVLNSLPKNSIILLSSDTLLFNTLYIQKAYGVRPDILMPSPERLGLVIRGNSILSEKKRIFSQKYKKWKEKDINVHALLESRDKIPIFSTTMQIVIGAEEKKVDWMPYGLFLKASSVSDEKLSEQEFLRKSQELWDSLLITPEAIDNQYEILGFTHLEIPHVYSQGSLDTANYINRKYKDVDRAKEYYEKSLKYVPENISAYLGIVYFYIEKNVCWKAEEYLRKGKEFVSENVQEVRVMEYILYSECFRDQKKAAEIQKGIPKEFKKSLEDRIGTTFFTD